MIRETNQDGWHNCNKKLNLYNIMFTINHRDLSLNYAIIKGISWENQFDMILGCVRKWSIPPNLRLLDDNMALYDAKWWLTSGFGGHPISRRIQYCFKFYITFMNIQYLIIDEPSASWRIYVGYLGISTGILFFWGSRFFNAFRRSHKMLAFGGFRGSFPFEFIDLPSGYLT